MVDYNSKSKWFIFLQNNQCHPDLIKPYLNWVFHRKVMINILKLRYDGQHFADNIFKLNFFNENRCILIQIELKYVPKGPTYSKTALVQCQAIIWTNDDLVLWHIKASHSLCELNAYLSLLCRVFLLKMSYDVFFMILLMMNQHWFRQWLGHVSQQAITWTNVNKMIEISLSRYGTVI